MNLRTTLALLALTLSGAAVLWLGFSLPPAVDPAPRPTAAADAGTRAVLAGLDAAAFRRLTLNRGDRTTALEREAAGGAWFLPGKWPARPDRVQPLVDLLAGLRTDFEPTPLHGDADLARFGLDKPAFVVRLETPDAKHALAFGEGPLTDETNRFSRPTWLRLDDRPEVVRLAPGLIALLDRTTDYYQQRRLFPGERPAQTAGGGERAERLTANSLTVEDKKEGGTRFTLTHNGDAWEMSAPARDRLAERPRDALLEAVPDLWAERLDDADLPGAAAAPAFCDGTLSGALTAVFWAGVNAPERAPHWLAARSGLDAPERTLSVTRTDGVVVTLLIGGPSGSRSRRVVRPPSPDLPDAPSETVEKEEFRYAKLLNNDQIFEIKGNKLNDVFVAVDGLRDSQLAHFNSGDATRLEINQGGQGIVLVKDKERWKLDKPLHADADRQKVTDLLNRLSGLEARGKDVIDGGDAKSYGLDQPAAVVKVTVDEKVKDEDKGEAKEKDQTKTRVLTFRLGKHDDATKKVYVQVEGWPRINAVVDGGSPGDVGLSALAKREAREYRGKRLFDFPADELAAIAILRGNDPSFSLKKDDKGGWGLTASPAVSAEADAAEANRVAASLSNLEVLEYVNDAPKTEELGPQYGLDKGALTVRLEFADKTKPARVLQVGKPREGTPGRFARLADAPDGAPTAVFAVADDAFTTLDRDALAYLPKQLWDATPEDVTAVRVHRKDQAEYTLKKTGPVWKIAGPFEADAAPASVQNLAAPLAAPRVESYKAFEAKQPADYGLDAPYLTAALTAKDGKEHTLTVGGPTAKDAKTRYAQADGKPAVFVVNDALVAALDRPALELLDPVLFRLGGAELDHVQSKIKVNDKEETLKLELQPMGWKATEGPGAPFPADLAAAARLQNLWFDLRAVRFADYGPNVKWETYGLAAPSAAVTIGVRKEDGAPVVEHTIKLGNPVEGGGRYARFDDQPGVAVLDDQAAKELARNHLDFVDHNVFSFDANAVTGLTLRKTDGTDAVELAKMDDGWKLTKPTTEQADEKALPDLLGQLATLRAVRVADYPAGKLDDFGLAKPEASVTIQLKPDAKTPKYVLLIGKTADEATGDRFAMVEGGQAVVVIPGALARRLTAGPLAFRDRGLLKVASDPDRVRLERDPRKAVFSKVEGSWKMTEPVKADLDQDGLDDFLNSLLSLRADELVAEKPTPEELKTYGLDNPEAKWRLQNGDKDLLTLLVGKMEKNGPRAYARLADRDLVFLLDPALTAKALGEFRSKTVWTTPLDAVQIVGLQYKRGDAGFELAKGDDGWKVVGKPDAKIDARTVEETLAALAGLKLERYAVDKDANLALFGLAPDPDVSLEIRTKSGQPFQLQLGHTVGDSKRRYARLPEPGRTDVFILNEADSEKIARDLAAFGKPPTAPAPMTP